ncbi:cystatin-C-like isoform X2 [Sphaeramia orbicularis]|uniref:cystatin-C-like isoform X2 n=1 Tax=Sphaeramia orbicularis TaxID=375764 RepID=UPI00117DC0F2|nr:cystatin-C-like isoform X2 [Sphaeramia orbicularis]
MLLVFYSVSCAWLVGFTAAGHAWVGHLRQVPVNRSDVRTAAELAVVEFNKANTEDPHTYRIDKITSAKMQIVAGVMYVLDVELENTRCNKSHTVQTENMGFKCSPKELFCNFAVLEIPWKHKTVLERTKCQLQQCCLIKCCW